MKKSLFVAVAALVFAVAAAPAQAGHAGQAGLGVLFTDGGFQDPDTGQTLAPIAPIGFFYGLSEQSMIHLGVGFNKYDVEEDSGDLETVLGFAAALEYDLWYGDNWGFGLFPGLAFQSASPEGEGDAATLFQVALNLGGHADVAGNFTVFFKHGLNIDIVDYGIEGEDSLTNFGTSGWNLGQFGAAFFFD